MIIDKNDGMVANVRMTSEEALALALAIRHSHLVVRTINQRCPNISMEHLLSVLNEISQVETKSIPESIRNDR